MKLKKFKERDNKRIGVIIFTLVCLFLISGAVLYRTFAIFEVKTNQNVIKGTVQGMGDIEFAFYIDDKIVKTAPSALDKEKYVFDEEKSNCTNDAHVYWDYQVWGPTVSNLTQTKTKCYLKFKTEYNETILNGAVPKIEGELTPVTIDENGTVHKADVTQQWYNYGSQKWANAVILKDGTVDNYKPGQEILESDIESYFVWIPRYRYQLWNGEEETSKFTQIENNLGTITDATQDPILNQQKEIKIEFENKHMPISDGTLKNQWLTHPAFVSFDSNGFWVGKFETGYNQNEENTNVMPTTSWNTTGAEQDEKNASKIIVKPNVYSWRKISLVNSFDNSKEYKPTLDSHMMKNSEWGSVSYLTNSKYGRCPNGICEEVRINNSKSCVTGSSSSIEPKIGFDAYNDYESNKPGEDTINVKNYNNKASNLSSTTNNYYGIFDIVGGTWERVMGVMNDQNGSSFINQAGFTSIPEAKYYDVYEYSSSSSFNLGLFGDGTKEIGPFYKGTYGIGDRQLGSWYAGEATFISKDYPWFERGDSYAGGSNASIFAFFAANCGLNELIGFRIVLTP